MPKQIKRHLIVMVVLVGIFLVARYLLVPDSFGEYGHYRGLSLQENEARPMHYAGEESCTACHKEHAEMKEIDVHSELSCETCHGPGLAHEENPDSVKVYVPHSREFCGRCHAENPARSRNVIFQINLQEHNPGKECIECHNPHQPWDLREQATQEEDF